MQTQIHTSTRLISLIQKAATKAGNDSKLAELIDDTRHHVSSWKAGKRTCPIEAQVLMAAIAGQDVETVMREALLERNAGTTRGEKLAAALGKSAAVAGATAALSVCGSSAMAANLPGILRCIFWFFS